MSKITVKTHRPCENPRRSLKKIRCPATLGRGGKIPWEKEKKNRDTYFTVFGEIDFERFGVIFKAQGCHGKQDILTVDRLPFLMLTLFGGWMEKTKNRPCVRGVGKKGLEKKPRKRTFACDERNELAHAFLHTFLRFFGNFGIFRKGQLHNPSHWSKIANISIRSKTVMSGALWWRYGLRGFAGHCDLPTG